MEQKSENILELWRMFLRRFWLITAVIVLGVVASVLVAFMLPPVYQSEAKILVENQQIPDELARSTITATASERLDKIQQRLMSRDNLARLIDELEIYAERTELVASEKIELLRESIMILPFIAPNSSDFGPRQITAFAIRVVANDAQKSADIANALVSNVLELNEQTRSEQASETRAFFQGREEELRGQLASVEAEISTFKRENQEYLPEDLRHRREELSQINENTFDLDRRILALEEQRGTLEARLRQIELNRTERAETPAQQQLRELRARLAQLKTVYAESHREIRAIRAQIAAIQRTSPATSEDVDRALRAAEIESMRTQIEQLDKQILLLREQKEAFERRKQDLLASIARTPDVEETLYALERQRNDLQAQLTAAIAKRVEAETGEKLELNQQAERFSVIERAVVPEFPVEPKKKVVVALGGAVSVALAFGLALLLETMRPVLRTSGQMQRQLDLTPVISIPFVRTAAERRWRRARFAAVILLLVYGVPAGLYTVDQHVMPLESIGERIADKTGFDRLVRTIKARF